MSRCVMIPATVWHDVCDFFRQIVSPCQECLRGNPASCWHSKCAAFPFRPIARDVLSVRFNSAPILPPHIRVENEIIGLLIKIGQPVLPSTLKLSTTNSKAVKSKAITRLVRQGRIIEKRVNEYTRYISLPPKRNPKK